MYLMRPKSQLMIFMEKCEVFLLKDIKTYISTKPVCMLHMQHPMSGTLHSSKNIYLPIIVFINCIFDLDALLIYKIKYI